jgi:DNA polymerase sigma
MADHKEKTNMSTKEQLEKVVEIMKRWQRIENAAVVQTAQVIDETENSLIRLVMEIIQRDSNIHHRVQQTIIDSLERQAINVFYDDLDKVWSSIEKHIAIEKQTIELAKASLDALEGTRNPVQQYLISYLLADEAKHDKLLDDLALIKKRMYP